ncbi:TVP38/TMEM64 family protein [Paraflavitalea pollutisoli]|uniref:TVP38/TMEM64 family protein n=1 Tax=Paraflavitalea pollutisoli TaxID=3034143 RepID=UPI0023EDBA25|nr:VTT domain-containing protein [Paraflavitalea sp. H1-2-19X]
MRKMGITLLVITTIIIGIFLGFPELEARCMAWLDRYRAQPEGFVLVSFCLLSVDVYLPVPSSIVMFANGAVLGIAGGTLLSLAAALTGSMAGFYTGRLSRRLAQRFVPANRQREADELFERYGPISIIITRGIPVLSEAMAILGGTRQMTALRFLQLNLLGYLPVCLLYSLFGHYAHSSAAFLWAFASSIVIAFLYWVGGRVFVKKSVPRKT